MAARGRPKAELVLSGGERRTLEEWAAWTGGGRLALRARIVLASAEGLSNRDVATKLEVGPHTAGKWRARFVDRRLAGLLDGPRSGAGRRITAAQADAVLARTLQTAPPAGAGLWSTRAMAAAVGLNQTAVSRLWRAAGLRPHQVATWRLFQDPRFAATVRLVAGLRSAAGDRILALATEPVGPGQPGSHPGPRSVAPTGPAPTGPAPTGPAPTGPAPTGPVPTGPAPVDPAPTGLAPTNLTPGGAVGEVLDFLAALDARVPSEWEVHVACIGRTARGHPAVRAWLGAHPRFHLHPVPVAQSWQRLLDRWAGRPAPDVQRRRSAVTPQEKPIPLLATSTTSPGESRPSSISSARARNGSEPPMCP
ncbi:transcriptional regulator, RpiR family [Micromonospora carbonacea]|uniref:Transcriptional regulator, RpiR family n=1 Tax=Micromonospora carbonacea TaxID=47853 RepID=A0A1C5AQ65_9ACTN|nr:transcriptional regulator, RpiR family [Micromonospora carbonacea]